MRYDFGAVYKEIRKSKGLSQADVCGEVLSRTTLAKFESGKVTPKYENMEFLLRQIDMSFGEFEYICNLYQPSLRSSLQIKLNNLISSADTSTLVELQKECQAYLRKDHDIPIQHISDLLQITIHIRQNGIKQLPENINIITKKIWQYLEKHDTWYESNLKMLNTILYFFSSNQTLESITEKVLDSLEKYKNYKEVQQDFFSILSNLATVYLRNNNMKDCERITEKTYQLARNLKRYDFLGFSQIRLGICRHDDNLIQKGLQLLELTEQKQMLDVIKHEINHFYKSSF